MEIVFNGEKEVLDKEVSLAQLLESYELNPNIVTVELNEKIINRTGLASVHLKEGDRIEVLMFMGGGI